MFELGTFIPILSTLSAGFPMLCFLGIVWWLDRYDREPVWLVGCAFLWGAVGAVYLSLGVSSGLSDVVVDRFIMSSLFESMTVESFHRLVNTVVVAPLVEEPAKALILGFVIWSHHFDNMTDGFVYGSAAGLGFGMTENYLYFVQAETSISVWGATVFVRTFYSAVMHATATAIVGASLGYGRWRGKAKLSKFGVLGLSLAIVVHAMWNGLLLAGTFSQDQSVFSLLNLFIFPVEFFCVGYVFHLCLQEEARVLLEELEDEVRRGLIPEGHPRILASWWARTGWSWMPEGVPQWTYIYHANMLAMRKRQVRFQGETALPRHIEDVRVHRAALESLLRGGRGPVDPMQPSPVTRFIRNFRRR